MRGKIAAQYPGRTIWDLKYAPGGLIEVQLESGAGLRSRSVILATGVSYRRLGAPGMDDMTGRGVYYGSALTEAAACSGQDIFIVGGANSAGQAAVYLARGAKSVTILVRGSSLEQSMSYYLIQQIQDIPNISVRTCTEVIGAEGSRLKRIGRSARMELNRQFGERFHLTLWVKVRKDWADDARALRLLGME